MGSQQIPVCLCVCVSPPYFLCAIEKNQPQQAAAPRSIKEQRAARQSSACNALIDATNPQATRSRQFGALIRTESRPPHALADVTALQRTSAKFHQALTRNRKMATPPCSNNRGLAASTTSTSDLDTALAPRPRAVYRQAGPQRVDGCLSASAHRLAGALQAREGELSLAYPK